MSWQPPKTGKPSATGSPASYAYHQLRPEVAAKTGYVDELIESARDADASGLGVRSLGGAR